MGRWGKILLALVMAIAVWTWESPASADRDCNKNLSLHSVLKNKNVIHKSSPVLEVIFAIEPFHALDEVAALAKKMKPLPNLTYARLHPEKASVLIIKVGYLKHAYFAVFNHSIYMNWALGRATTYQTRGEIITGSSLTRSNSIAQYAGHDMPAYVAKEFEDEFLKEHPTDDPDSLKLQVESSFWSQVMLPLLEIDSEATLVAASLDAQFRKTTSHELLHASFYESAKLREKISVFWEERVSEKDKKAYLKVLKRENYDVDNYDQVINEFYAYTLEEEGSGIFPEGLLKKYRKSLRDYINGNR